jgi:hypothetical protein
LPVSDGRQQLAVKAAETVEVLRLDRVRVDLQGVALQGQHEDAPALRLYWLGARSAAFHS